MSFATAIQVYSRSIFRSSPPYYYRVTSFYPYGKDLIGDRTPGKESNHRAAARNCRGGSSPTRDIEIETEIEIGLVLALYWRIV